MCGIAGYCLAHLGDLSFDYTSYSLSRLLHRGPDASGAYIDNSGLSSLVHTRLSIQDPSPLGNQPFYSRDGSVALVFNGEIYNFCELRNELIKDGYDFSTNTDTEVLLNLYLQAKSGHSFRPPLTKIAQLLNRLNGIFAFAIWDSQYRALLIARDAFGIKPLYLRETPEGIFFSSEIKSLPLTNISLDHIAIDRYLTYLWSPGFRTPAKGITKFPPGHSAWLSNGDIIDQTKWYFSASSPSANESSPSLSPSTYIQRTQQLVRQAVHRQMVSDVPLGAFLSGGLDSSTVVSFAREVNPNIRCFTIDTSTHTDSPPSDDLPYAKLVSRSLNVPLDIVSVSPDTLVQNLEAMIWHLDEPLADPAALNLFLISEHARKNGIKVLLSGAAGDDIFSGYRRHRALRYDSFLSYIPRSARQVLSSISSRTLLPTSYGRKFKKYLAGFHLDTDERLVNYFRWINRKDLDKLYSPSTRHILSNHHESDPMLEYLSTLNSYSDPLSRMLSLEQRFFLADHNLIYTDKMSMAAGVEVRVPFLDVDLVEFSQTIPSAFKQHGSDGKWILKKAMEPFLPREVIYRPKTGFGLPLRRWLQSDLRDWLHDILSPYSIHNRGIFDAKAVASLISANEAGKVDASYTLFSLACIEIWCRHFIDKSTSQHSANQP